MVKEPSAASFKLELRLEEKRSASDSRPGGSGPPTAVLACSEIPEARPRTNYFLSSKSEDRERGAPQDEESPILFTREQPDGNSQNASLIRPRLAWKPHKHFPSLMG